MSHTCRHCSRVNPPEALYCYHDGVALDAAHSAPLAAGAQMFSHPFVFPSGRCCRNFDELVRACDDDWNAAKEMLHVGFLSGFLDAVGRPDLAVAAQQAAKHPDVDRGLEQLLQQMPCTARVAARLNVHPLEINLGQMTAVGALPFTLHLENQGGGLLHGSITSEADWLALGDAPGSPRKVFQFLHELELAVQVVGKSLRASTKPIEGRLLVETNGGIALVMVRVEVPTTPFPHGVLAGATSPRQLATLAKKAPKQAAALFENGAVRKWYETNGWMYPIVGPQAAGVASVQQFFEVLGLAKPPRIEMSERSVQLRGRPGDKLEHVLLFQAVERKYVFAQARSTVGWLEVAGVTASGYTGRVALRVPQVPQLPGHQLHGFVHVTANGGQRFTVEVHLTVAGERAQRYDTEVIPVARVEEVLPEVLPVAVPVLELVDEIPEVISIAPMKLADLLDALPDDLEER